MALTLEEDGYEEAGVGTAYLLRNLFEWVVGDALEVMRLTMITLSGLRPPMNGLEGAVSFTTSF